MLSHGTTAVRALLPLFGACVILAASGPEDREPIPSDLKIVAQYGAGEKLWTSWRYTITGEGKVAQEIFGRSEKKKMTQLSKDDLRDLIAKTKEVDFFSLKNDYDYQVTDNDTLILDVTLDKKTHKVVVYAPDHLQQNKEVKRFFRLWSEVLRKVPSPNPEQQPEIYKP